MTRLLLLASTALLAACATATAETEGAPTPSGSAASQAVSQASERAAIAEKNAELARFYEAYDQAQLAMSPLSKAYRGIKDQDYGKWDEFTDEAELAGRNLDVTTLAAMRTRYDRTKLSPADQLSYDLFEYDVERGGSIFAYRKNAYVFDQMNGAQSSPPAFLINIHRVDTLADAEAYVARLQSIDAILDQGVAEAKDRQAQGVLQLLDVDHGLRGAGVDQPPARHLPRGRRAGAASLGLDQLGDLRDVRHADADDGPGVHPVVDRVAGDAQPQER